MTKSDILLAILNHRNTPNESGYSSAQCLMSRRTKALLHTTSNLLKPEVSIGRHSSLIAAQQCPTHYYNQHSNDPESLQNVDIVRIKPSGKGQKLWKQAVVNKKLGFRSYSVETSDGSYVRNRVHLCKSHEDPHDTPVLSTRTVEPTVKTTSPSTSLHSTELEHCIPTHSSPQHEAQSPCASQMRTDTHQTPTRSDTGYTTRFGRQV